MIDISRIFDSHIEKKHGVYIIDSDESDFENQHQTNDAFTKKWCSYNEEDANEQEVLFEFQKRWYLKLYGFDSELQLADYLKGKEVILDAGSGLGYKSKWFADLSPSSLVLGIDYSDAVYIAAEKYKDVPNLIFAKGDIAKTKLKSETIDYVSCDQVIMHTEDPSRTFSELTRVLKFGHEFAVYVYSKKSLPRELLDDHFRLTCKNISHDDMLAFSEQLTTLGKRLSELKLTIDVPEIPLLGIKGGSQDIQRFFYWNFLKCFWNEDLGWATSVIINYDWYSPTNAKRYSKSEFLAMAENNHLRQIFLHEEEACFSGRFKK